MGSEAGRVRVENSKRGRGVGCVRERILNLEVGGVFREDQPVIPRVTFIR